MGNTSGRGYAGKLPANEEDLPFLQVLSDKRFLDWRQRPDPETGKPLTAEDERRMKLEQQSLPVHISGNVFLSDQRGAQKIGRLKHLGITYVLNVGGAAVQPSNTDMYKEQNIDYKAIDAGSQKAILDKLLSEAREYIAKARDEERNVLVYCKTGYDLSALFVASEKMLLEARPILETVAECRRLRGNDFLQNMMLQEQLVGLARRKGLLGITPGEKGSFVDAPGLRNMEGLNFDPAVARSAFRGELARPSSTVSARSQSSTGSQRSMDSEFGSSFSSSIKNVFNSMGSLSQSFNISPQKRVKPMNEEDKVYMAVLRDPLCLNWRNRPDPGTGDLLTLDEQDKVSKDQMNLPVQMCEGVFLSNTRAVNRVGRLKHLGITHVLNLAGPSEAPSSMEMFPEADILYKIVNAADKGEHLVLDTYLAEVRDFIAEAREQGGSCLLYCKTGSDLSGLFAAAEKMLLEGTTVLETVAMCRWLRGNAFLQNDLFQEQLVQLARKNDLLGRPEPYLRVLPSDKLKIGSESTPLLS